MYSCLMFHFNFYVKLYDYYSEFFMYMLIDLTSSRRYNVIFMVKDYVAYTDIKGGLSVKSKITEITTSKRNYTRKDLYKMAKSNVQTHASNEWKTTHRIL